MTNTEYEKLCVDAAMTRKDAIHLIHAIDTKIDELEATLAKAQEARREIVNQYNLNKCKHDYVWHTGYARWYCSKCEAAK